MNNIEEICKIASSWWTNVIKNPKMDNGDESQAGMLINMLATLNTSKKAAGVNGHMVSNMIK